MTYRDYPSITGLILAGGRATRMQGKDKGLLPYLGRPLYQQVISRLITQVDHIIINANRHIDIYQQSGYPVITDQFPNFYGPLAGLLAGLQASQTDWVVAVPCDMPSIPLTLVKQLWRSQQPNYLSYANDSQRDHPTLCVLHKQQIPFLQQYLQQGNRKLTLFFRQQKADIISFHQEKACFVNINTVTEYQRFLQLKDHDD